MTLYRIGGSLIGMTEGVATEAPSLTVQDLADYFRVDPRTVRVWVRKGKGPTAVKVGREWRFRPSDLAQWVEDRTREGVA